MSMGNPNNPTREAFAERQRQRDPNVVVQTALDQTWQPRNPVGYGGHEEAMTRLRSLEAACFQLQARLDALRTHLPEPDGEEF